MKLKYIYIYIYIYIFAPWRKTYDPPRHPIQNQRHCVAKKGPPIQSYGFSNSHVWLHSWAIKKAGHQRIVTFLLCWRRLLRVPWTARRSNQSILKEIRPEYSLERLMLKLKLQWFGLLMWRHESFEYTLKLAKTEGRRRSGWQRIRWLDGITDSLDMSLSKLCVSVTYKEAWWMAVHGALTCRRQLNNWTKCLVYVKEESFRAGSKPNMSKSCRGW